MSGGGGGGALYTCSEPLFAIYERANVIVVRMEGDEGTM